MPEMKKASSPKLAGKNDLQPKSYHRQSGPSTLKIRIGEILFACLQDLWREDTWQEFERLLRLRWSGPPISSVKTNTTTAIPQHTQAVLKPGQARTPNWSHRQEKINPDEDKAFSGREISAGVNL
ncbi:MAG: hypothetical protein ABII09_10965 [Planctomycetota bacterium]